RGKHHPRGEARENSEDRFCHSASVGTSLALRLGKIGHARRRDAARAQSRQLEKLIGKVRLVEVPETVSKPRELRRDLGVETGERRLKAHDARERLRPRPDPASKKAIEMARADAATSGEICDAQPAVR